MGEYTPGPWVIIPARPYDGDDPELDGSFEAFAGIEGSDGSPVCVFGDASGSATMFENEHDYHLIAAAPELLEALKALVRIARSPSYQLGFANALENAADAAEAAIAKAEASTPSDVLSCLEVGS